MPSESAIRHKFDAVDQTTDICARSCGGVLLLFATIGVTFAILCIQSCEFLIYNIPNVPKVPPVTNLTRLLQAAEQVLPAEELASEFNATTLAPSLAPTENSNGESPAALFSTISFGLFLYLDPDDEVCYYYDRASDLDSHIRIARLGGVVAAGSSAIAGLLLMIEFCCFRFWCSRVFINIGFVLAIFGAPLTFALYADSQCRSKDGIGGSYLACELGQGGIFALVALSSFAVTLILTCVTPKSVPLIRLARDKAKNSTMDCFCCSGLCIGRKRNTNDHHEGLELTVSSDHVLVADGHTYQQYHDETAGFTSQNQYTAAYKRWLVFEADYEEALVRFKQECVEAEVNWRLFLRKAKARQRVDIFPDEETTMQEEEDEAFLDDELLRFVDVLTTLRDNCNFAKEVMGRIQQDINKHTRSEDKRQQAELEPRERKKSSDAVGRSRHHYPEEEVEFYSSAMTTGMEESPLLVQSTSNAQFSEEESSAIAMDQDGDIFTSARMEPSLMTTSRQQHDTASIRTNPSVATNGSMQRTSPVPRQRRPVANFVLGFRTVNWAWNTVRREKERYTQSNGS